VPFVQRVQYRQSLKEQIFTIKAQNAVTKDNVIMQLDGVLYMRVKDPVKCSYGAKDPMNYSYILAQSVMRSEIGKLTLDQTFEERDAINANLLASLKQATEEWGLECRRYEIKDIKVSDPIKKVMNLEAESERKKRAEILLSEGKKAAQINNAEAIKRGIILSAQGRSEEVELRASALVERIKFISRSLDASHGLDAARLTLAQNYLSALQNLANPLKSVILKQNLTKPEDIVRQALRLLDSESLAEDEKKEKENRAP